jgi:glycosyltransferase involved in cell wall biosynthesis
MNEVLPKLLPVTILITSYNRKNLLEKCVQLINDRTFYPFRIIVIDNNSTDGSQDYLRHAKTVGKIFDAVFLPENVGQSRALNIGFSEIDKWEEGVDRPKRPSSDFFVSTNEDLFPPMLGQENCWLTRMIDILERHEPEFGGITMRFQRLARTDIDESKEIIECYKGFNSTYRLMRRSDIRKLGEEPFGRLLKWNSNTTSDKYKLQLKKKFGFTTHLYADHAGFQLENRGYEKGFTNYFTYAENKANIAEEKPYPDIDELTNEPIKINHPCDIAEQKLRDDYKKLQSGEIKKETTIFVLTYKRINGLIRIIDSIKKHTTETLYDLIVIIDGDDTESYQWCIENNIKCILSNWQRECVAQTNLGYYISETPYIVKFDDDMEITEDNWLANSLKIFKEKFKNDSGLLCFNDGLSHGAVFTTGLTSKKFIHDVGGHLHYPKFKHFGSDREIVRLAKLMDSYCYEDGIKINHYHPDNKNLELANEKDEVYSSSEKSCFKKDQDLKHQRQAIEDILKDKNYCDFK